MPCAPSWASELRTRSGSLAPVATTMSAPAISSPSTALRCAARVTTTVSGTSAAPRTSCESSGSRASESKTIRLGWRCTPSMRAVSCGSSASAVPIPTATASTSARQWCESRRLSSPLIHLLSPVRVATLPSSVIADLNRIHGRPVRACLRNGWLSRLARSGEVVVGEDDLDPLVAEDPGPRPAALSVGSSLATTTRAIPASMIASVHGGVRPVWQHGSSDTYIVAPRACSAVHAPSAARSACGPPSSAWNPSATTSPSLTITAPTSGFGLVMPRPHSASTSARLRCSWSVA